MPNGLVPNHSIVAPNAAKDRVSKWKVMEATMKTGLAIVMRNPKPARESNHPHSWLVHVRDGVVSVNIEHDIQNNPYVVSKNAA